MYLQLEIVFVCSLSNELMSRNEPHIPDYDDDHLSGPMARTFPRQKKKKSIIDRMTPLDQKICKLKFTMDLGNYLPQIIVNELCYLPTYVAALSSNIL